MRPITTLVVDRGAEDNLVNYLLSFVELVEIRAFMACVRPQIISTGQPGFQ
jgi:hypothetical protein